MSLYVPLPWDRQPLEFSSYAAQWRGRALTALLAGRPLATDFSPVVNVGTITRETTQKGIASVHSASGTTIQRAVIRNSTLGTSSTVGASLLVVFRTTTVGADWRIGALGSDNGGGGNTIFSIGTGSANAGHLRATIGGSGGNNVLESTATTINDGAVHAALVTLTNFSGGSGAAALYYDGALLASSSALSTGTASLYNYIVSGGFRRGGTDSTGANCRVLLCQPFLGALSAAEGALLTRDPWQLFAPRRIFVPAAAAGGVPTLSLSTYAPGSLTSSGWTPRVTAS